MAKKRSAGNYLLTKLLDSICSNRKEDNFSELDYFAYITIMQCLQVEQINRAVDDKCGLIGMRTLYIKLLTEDDLWVLRWTLEYLMQHTTSSDLRHANLLVGFLNATNRLQLHDLDAYALPKKQMTDFVPTIELKGFLSAFVKVPWIDVALVRWLHSLNRYAKRVPQITQNLLYKLVGHVKKIEHQSLRHWASEHLLNYFSSSIQVFSLVDYMRFCETLFDAAEDIPFIVKYKMSEKIRACTDMSDQLVQLNRAFFEKVCFTLMDNFPYYQIFQQLQEVPKSCHGWWRLALLFQLHNKPQVIDLYHAEYDLNIELFQKPIDLKELQEHLLEKFNCKAADEKLYVLENSVDLFVETNLTDSSQIEELHVSPIDLLEQGTVNTLLHFIQSLSQRSQRLQDNQILATIVQLWKKYSGYHSLQHRIASRILNYAKNCLNEDEREKLVEEMMPHCLSNRDIASLIHSTNSVPKYLVLQEILGGEILTGDALIEFALAKQLEHSCGTVRRDAFIEFAYRKSEEVLFELFNKLIRINLNMNRNGLILENSKENRAQMRILRAMLHTDPKSKSFWTNNLWQLLLSSSSQPNKICFLYECLVAQQLPIDETHFEQLLERIELIGSLASAQQDSMISVLYIYCIRKADLLKLEHFESVFELLNQLMNDLPMKTQSFIRLVLHKLALKCEEKSLAVPLAVDLKTPPNIVFEDKMEKTITEVRLMLPGIMHFSPSDIILHIINAPIDEYRRLVWVDHRPLLLYDKLRKVFASQKMSN